MKRISWLVYLFHSTAVYNPICNPILGPHAVFNAAGSSDISLTSGTRLYCFLACTDWWNQDSHRKHQITKCNKQSRGNELPENLLQLHQSLWPLLVKPALRMASGCNHHDWWLHPGKAVRQDAGSGKVFLTTSSHMEKTSTPITLQLLTILQTFGIVEDGKPPDSRFSGVFTCPIWKKTKCCRGTWIRESAHHPTSLRFLLNLRST